MIFAEWGNDPFPFSITSHCLCPLLPNGGLQLGTVSTPVSLDDDQEALLNDTEMQAAERDGRDSCTHPSPVYESESEASPDTEAAGALTSDARASNCKK